MAGWVRVLMRVLMLAPGVFGAAACDMQGRADDPVLLPAMTAPVLRQEPPAVEATVRAEAVPASPQIALLKSALAYGRDVPVVENPAVTVQTQLDTPILPLDSMTLVRLTDPRLRLLGGRYLYGTSTPFNKYALPQAVSYATGLDWNTVTTKRRGINNGVEFYLAPGLDRFQLSFTDDTGTSDPRIHVEVGGVRTAVNGYSTPGVGKGSPAYVVVTLPPATKTRRITLHFGYRPFQGIYFENPAKLVARPTNARPVASVVFVGDSITEGSKSTNPVFSWASLAADKLGILNPINVGIGGTGYVRKLGDRPNLNEHTEDVLRAVDDGPPDAVVVAAGINDCSNSDMPTIGAAAVKYFRTLRAAAPTMPIFVLGPFTSYTGVPYTRNGKLCRQAIFTAARQVSLTYPIDVSDWVTLTNRDMVFDGTVNGPHPVNGGHAIYARRAARAIRDILNAL